MQLTDQEINRFNSVEEFVSGSVLLIDKPLTWTSFDVVNRIKSFVKKNFIIPPNEQGHEQRFKIGHAGTLDPLATGLLVICTGKMTKRIDEIMGGTKEYTGTIRFGKTTPSYDLETLPEGEYPTDQLKIESLKKVAETMCGEQWQTPPAYSAKQVNGKRAYVSARKGIVFEIPKSKILVESFDILSFNNPDAEFRIRCSKGTYIRTIAHEIGKNLDSGSHLVGLRRTESAPFRIESALNMNEILEKLELLSNKKPPVTI